jgi:hypothetical protein
VLALLGLRVGGVDCSDAPEAGNAHTDAATDATREGGDGCVEDGLGVPGTTPAAATGRCSSPASTASGFRQGSTCRPSAAKRAPTWRRCAGGCAIRRHRWNWRRLMQELLSGVRRSADESMHFHAVPCVRRALDFSSMRKLRRRVGALVVSGAIAAFGSCSTASQSTPCPPGSEIHVGLACDSEGEACPFGIGDCRPLLVCHGGAFTYDGNKPDCACGCPEPWLEPDGGSCPTNYCFARPPPTPHVCTIWCCAPGSLPQCAATDGSAE